MVEDIFTVRIQNYLYEKEDEVVTAHAEDWGQDKSWWYLITYHIDSNINANDNHIKDEHARPNLECHISSIR